MNTQPITNNKPLTIFITGAAGYVGAMLVDIFSKRPDVERIIALDKAPLPDFVKNAPKLYYICANTSDAADAEGSWQKKVAAENPDVVIHTAWQIREMYGKTKRSLQWKWNIDGSDNVFDFSFGTSSVKKLVHFSTVASYGAFSTNTVEHRFTEAEGFRKTDYSYAEEKRIAEEHLRAKFNAKFATSAKEALTQKVQVAIVNPAGITGPRGRYMRVSFGLQSALAGQLKQSFIQRAVSLMVSWAPITPKWCRQFVHEDDIADIVALLSFGPLKNDYESFNACPPGPVVTGRDMAANVGKKILLVYPWMVRLAFFFAWHLTRGRVPTSRGVWKAYSYPIAVDGSKITREYGYQYKYLSKDAFTKKEGRYASYIKNI
jgi:nucleoside-diphosphate-sugar epimerase